MVFDFWRSWRFFSTASRQAVGPTHFIIQRVPGNVCFAKGRGEHRPWLGMLEHPSTLNFNGVVLNQPCGSQWLPYVHVHTGLTLKNSILCPHNVFMCFVWNSEHVAMISLYNINPLNAELNPICYLLALLGAHHFLHVSRIRVKSLILRLLMSYLYGAPILDVSRSHTTTHHSR